MTAITNNKILPYIVIITFIFFASGMMLLAQNTNLPVGAIPGEIDVSPMGAATYTIPVEVVSGTNGMQPNLSIVYNSFSGMGLLGMKWDLAGISAITRCGQTPYFDSGNLTAVQFSSSDRYMIDGMRLINIGSQQALQFAPEVENFTRFFPINSYDSWIAYTEDGSIIEYGNNSYSQQQLGSGSNSILSWYISKITDANGNSMTYYYWQPQTGEIYISSISYSGNSTAGIQPYANVSFGYKELKDTLGKNTSYIAGYAAPRTQILETVTVSYSNTVVRKYQFNYNLNDSGERSPHLKEIVLYGEGGTKQLNATSVMWGDPHYYTSDGLNKFDGYMITGDFDGDGYTDYVVYGQDSLQNKWTLYTGSASGSFTDTGITGTHQQLGSNGTDCFFYKADVNGDGCDELIIVDWVNDINYKIKILSLKNEAIEIDSKTVQGFYQLYFGDFDGDGSIDILIMLKETWNNNKCSFQFYLDSQFTGSRGLPTNINDPCKVRVGDFTGSGKTDVELNYLNNDLYTCYFNNINYNFYWNNTLGTATYLNERYSGDFNGDGIADLLIFDGSWKLYFGKGDGTFTNYTTVSWLETQTDSNPYGWVVPKYKILIADLDRDGKDDIVQLIPPTSLKIIYSKSCINEQYKYSHRNQSIPGNFTSHKSFNIADFNNDGTLDIVVKESIGQARMVYLNKNRQYEFPKIITDGLGKTYKLVYKPKYLIANNNTSQKYFCHILDNLQISNGLDDFNSFQYKYNQSAFSWLRRSFVGFKEFISIDNQVDKVDSCFFVIENSKQILKPISQSTYINNLDINKKTYNFSFINLGSKRYMPYYEETTILDKLQDIKTIITDSLDEKTGRLIESNTKTYNDCNASTWLHSETNTYTYQTITLNGNQKKTVPTKILTTQQYGSSGVVISDTLTCNYSPTGLLNWQRQGNIDGSITTAYSNYTTAGLCQGKTVSATGCTSRTETYTYDATQRFVTKITNPLNHSTNFTYDGKTGNKLTEKDPNNLTTAYSYDFFGNLTQINYPDNTQTTISLHWNTASFPPNAKYYSKTVSTGKPDLYIYYDILGREVCRKKDDFHSDTRYNAKGEVTKTSYPYKDPNTLDNDKIWSEFSYDQFGRQDSVKAPYTDLSYSYNNRKVTVTDHLRGNIQTWKDYDALGRIVQAKDEGGTIDYSYSVITSGGKPRQQAEILTNGATTTIRSNLWGNRLSIEDPNAGTITYTYNGFNELIKQVDAKNNTTNFQYDKLGRMTQKQSFYYPSPQIVSYTYDNTSPASKGIGKLSAISVNNKVEETFTYDSLSRIATHEKVNNGTNCFKYVYNANGQLQSLIYPSGFGIKYNYTSTGLLKSIKRIDNNKSIYTVYTLNKFYEPLSYSYDNSIQTECQYNEYGLLTRIQTGNKKILLHKVDPPRATTEIITVNNLQTHYSLDSAILNYRYAYDEKGLMSVRSESVFNRLEQFTYDNLDRLVQFTTGKTGQTGTLRTVSYANNGNITQYSKVGNYTYGSDKPNAVTQIAPVSSNVISANDCAVTYNFFNQPCLITEDPYQLDISYGSDQERNLMVIKNNNTTVKKYYYINKYYEIEKETGSNLFHYYHYIYGDHGVVALYEFSSPHSLEIINKRFEMGGDSVPVRSAVDSGVMYYIHTDHLGSYCAITNDSAQVVQRNIFDPWGNFYRFSLDTIHFIVDSTEINVEEPPRGGAIYPQFDLIRRGFTGHEHYPELKIINMNGRLYDPVIGRFFSPDNYVQLPEFTQGFNRYSYCLNNPLKYKDPDGQRYRDLDDDYGLFKNGHVKKLRDTYDNFDRLIALDENGKETNKQIKVYDRSILPDLAKYRKGFDGTNYAISESSETGDVYLFASKHSDVEWALDGFKNNGRNEYVIYTDHTDRIKIPARNWNMFQDKPILFEIHSHPTNNMDYRKASGFGETLGGDKRSITNYYNSTGIVPDNYIYHPYSESLIKYTPWNPQSTIKTGVTYPGGLLFLYK